MAIKVGVVRAMQSMDTNGIGETAKELINATRRINTLDGVR
jgi:hypothetical protein